MPDSDQTDSNASPIGKSDSQSATGESAPDSDALSEPVALRFLTWLGVSIVLAILVGILFSTMPARFRLLGLLGIAQGIAVGAVVCQVARPFKLHYAKLAVIGGFLTGAASVAVTAILWWQGWAEQLKQPTKPRPDAALAAQMLAQMKKPDSADPEQLNAYEESRRLFSEFLDAESAPPETDFSAWLVHRASLLITGPTAAVAIGLLELLLAGAASSLLARSSAISPFCSKCQNWRRVVRSQSFSAPLPADLNSIVPDLPPSSQTTIAIHLAGCECQCRPAVNVDIAVGTARQKLTDVSLTEDQFLDVIQLLDEAQGIAPRRLLIDGRLISPFFIFIKGEGQLDDIDILSRFGLGTYRQRRTVPSYGRRAVIADSGCWKLLADDFSYTLWDMESTRPTLSKVAEQFDVFACSVGDSDESFDFIYYVGGSLIRKYTVTDPHYDGGSVVENVGEPLPAESDLLTSGKEKLAIVLGIAQSLGINVDFREADLRIYGSTGESS